MRNITILLVLTTALASAADDYPLGPDSLARQNGAPTGKVESFQFTGSKIFPETKRDCWLYVPAQYDAARPAALFVFQDGHAYVSETAQIRAPIVLDNLIHRGEIPVTIGLFVNPGHRGENGPAAAGWGDRNNRSFEYDSLGDAYVRFLLEELLPYVTERWKLNLTSDPKLRGICGMSSGGICAFTAAWERPQAFGLVLSHIGSFANIRGGHVYPALIRKTERKPIRVFLQDGTNDLNNVHGNWPLANQDMASALAYAGYDHRFVLGDGAHNGKHGGAIFPDSLRWLFRPDPGTLPLPITKDNLAGDEALSRVLQDGGKPGDWELVAEGHAFTDAAATDAEGNFYYADLPRGSIHRVGAESGRPEVWLENGPKLSGLEFGHDGKLYGASQGDTTGEKKDTKRILVIDPASKAIETLATEVQPNDLVVTRSGFVFFTDTSAGAVVRVPTGARGMARPPTVAEKLRRPNGIALSPNQGTLYVSELDGSAGWTFLLDGEGNLRGGERNLVLRTPTEKLDSGGDGMVVDRDGRPWITSNVGIQIFDPTGRLGGVLARPGEKGCVSCGFAGKDRSYFYALCADRVYRRKTLTAGQAP